MVKGNITKKGEMLIGDWPPNLPAGKIHDQSIMPARLRQGMVSDAGPEVQVLRQQRKQKEKRILFLLELIHPLVGLRQARDQFLFGERQKGCCIHMGKDWWSLLF